jgi:hypothetical protein
MLDNILCEVDSNDMIRKPSMCTLNLLTTFAMLPHAKESIESR